MDSNPVFTEYASSHTIPEDDAGRDAKNVLVESFGLDIWKHFKFDEVDLDRDGTIDHEELTRAVEKVGKGPAKGLAGAVIAALDKDGDRRIDREEAEAALGSN